MCHHDTALTKLQKLRQDHIDLRIIHNILIPDTCQLLNFKRNGYIRIDESGKTIHDLTAGHLDRTDLDDPVIHRRESCGLDIEHHIILVQTLSLIIGHDLLQIIYQISLHTIDDFEKVLLVRILVSGILTFALFRLPQIVPDMIGIGKTLYHTVICDGDGAMPPFIGAFYNIFGFRDAVHITHFGMAVQFHTFSGGSIHSCISKIRDLLDSGDGADGKLMVKLIHHADSLYL